MVDIVMRNKSIVQDPRLGRLIEFDPRSKDHRLFNATPPDGGIDLRKREIISRNWITDPKNPWLDQKAISMCVMIANGNGLNYERGIQHRDFAWCLNAYDQIQREDEWPGPIESEGGEGGTSILAALKWLKRNGYIKDYKWAFTLEEVLVGIGYYGPAIFGSMWTYDMVYPKKSSRLCRPTGREMGGHAVCATSYNHRAKHFEGPNWPPPWNKTGFFRMTEKDFDSRRKYYGEVAFITK